MIYQLAANLVFLLHLAFVAFVILGGLLVLRWPRLIWLHLTAATWGALIELAGFICPLTPLEVMLRQRGGQAGYEGGFIEHYLVPILYPSGLTRELQIWLGVAVLVINTLVYACYFLRKKRATARSQP